MRMEHSAVVLYGDAEDNELIGDAGKDKLDGGSGQDSMITQPLLSPIFTERG